MQKPEIIFKDKDYLAVNKPPGLLIVRGRGSASAEENLTDILKGEYGEIYIVHRLDRDVSGVTVFARNAAAHRHLSMAFEKREVVKKYFAFLWGRPPKKGRVDKPVRDGARRCSVHFDGRKSVTEYFVLRQYKKAAFAELSPLTGRRHQLRVHMSYIGHPIVGDKIYGDPEKQALAGRLMLHCRLLEFRSLSGKILRIRKDPPADFMDEIPENLLY